jgi:hypothetical protein
MRQRVAVDADQVRQDLNKLLKSLEHLSLEALREVSNRALALIDEKNGEVKRSFTGGVVGGAVSLGDRLRGCSADQNLLRKSGGRGRRGPVELNRQSRSFERSGGPCHVAIGKWPHAPQQLVFGPPA